MHGRSRVMVSRGGQRTWTFHSRPGSEAGISPLLVAPIERGKLDWAMSDFDPIDSEEAELRAEHLREAARLRAETDDDDFRWLMRGPRGRRIVWRMLQRARVFQSSYHPNFGEMSKNEGQKMHGYWLLERISTLCPDTYTQMMQEQKNGSAVASNRSDSQD